MNDKPAKDDLVGLINRTLGPYLIREKIGRGGMADVFRAYQPALDRFVAIKVLSPALADEPGFTKRFEREARAVARLNHPNILQVYDFGVEDKYHYIVMRYVEGAVTLHTLMQRGEPVERLIDYVLQVADALNYAHDQGIVHRDVKPSNILIDGKWALLSDFGLVLDLDKDERLTVTGRGIGTAAYISPEQARGAHVDGRTDIYALGVILYEALTGIIPHNAPTPLALVARRVTEPVPPLREVKPEISESLEMVTLRALVRDPSYRYSSAAEFSEAIKKAQTDPHSYQAGILTTELLPPVPTEPNPPAATQRVQPTPKPKRLGLIIGGGLIVVVLLGLIFFNLSTTSGNSQDTLTPAVSQAAPNETAIVVAATETDPPDETVAPTQTPTPGPTSPPTIVAAADVQVWSGPGEHYELLGILPEEFSTEVTSRDESGAWLRIKTSLGNSGMGWIPAGEDLVDAALIARLPVAVSPPTPTPTVTPQPPTATPTPTDTPAPPTATSSATATATEETAPVTPTPTPTPVLPAGELDLIEPVSTDEPSFGLTEFVWRWSGTLPEDQGFEVRVWRDGEDPAGVHDSVLDNKTGQIEFLGDETYRLTADISDTPGVNKVRGEYNWTVVLVQIEPEYRELGTQAKPGRLRFEPPGSGGGDGGGGDGIFN